MPKFMNYLSPIITMHLFLLAGCLIWFPDKIGIVTCSVVTTSGYIAAEAFKTRVVQDYLIENGFWSKRLISILIFWISSVFISFGFVSLFFSNADLIVAAKGGLSSIFFVENVYAWLCSDSMFARISPDPLRHTWIVSLLIQLLLGYFALAYYLSKDVGRGLYMTIFVFLLLSAGVLKWHWQSIDHDAVLMLAPFNFFEFLIGVFTFEIFNSKSISKTAASIILGISAILLACSLALPQPNKLMLEAIVLSATIGAIIGLKEIDLNVSFTKVLYRLSLATFFTQYPLYLISLSFFQSSPGPRRIIVQIGFGLLIATLGYQLFRLVFEKPRSARFTRFTACLLACVACMTFLSAVDAGGWAWRAEISAFSESAIKKYRKDELCQDGVGFCRSNSNGNWIIIGDRGVVDQYSRIMDEYAHGKGKILVEGAIFADCLPIFDSPDKCSEKIDNQLKAILSSKYDAVVLAGSWLTALRRDAWERRNSGVVKYAAWKLNVTINKIKESGKKAILLGLIPALAVSQEQCYSRPLKAMPCGLVLSEKFDMQVYVNNLLKAISDPSDSFEYLDLLSYLCDGNGGCKAGDGSYTFYHETMDLDSKNLGAYIVLQQKIPGGHRLY